MKHTVEQVNRMIGISHAKGIVVFLNGKEMEVAPPTCGTIEEACRYLSLLPKSKIQEDDPKLLGRLVDCSSQLSPMYYALALMVYGEEKCLKKNAFSRRKKIDKYAKRLRGGNTPEEVKVALLRLLSSQVCADFFGMVSALMSVLIVETE